MLLFIICITGKTFSQVKLKEDGIGWTYDYIPSNASSGGLENYQLLNEISATAGRFAFKNETQAGILRYSSNYNSFQQSFLNLENHIQTSYKVMPNFSFQTKLGIGVYTNYQGDLNLNDLVFTGISTFIKTWGEEGNLETSLEAGIAYETYLGEPAILPVIAFRTPISPNVSLTAGFPYSALAFHLNNQNTIKLAHVFEGSFYKLSENPSGATASIALQKLGISFQHELFQSWSFHLGSDYILKSETNIPAPGGDEEYNNSLNAFSINAGFNIKL